MKQFMFAFLVLSILLMTPVHALDLEYYGIEDTINSDLSVDNKITFKFGKPITHLDYQLAFKVSDLTARSSFESADCKSNEISTGTLISCDFVGMTEEEDLLELSFRTEGSVKKVDDRYRFFVNYGITLPIDRYFVKIKLPENAILSEPVANQSYFPADGLVSSDGRRISVYWENENITKGETLQFTMSYTMPSTVSNLVVVTVAIIIIVVMVAVAIYAKKGSGSSKREEDVVKSVLNTDEKKIVNLLISKGGSSGQKSLVRETDFSKAKVSRILKSLKERGVIEVEPVSGRENRIILKITQKVNSN